jgi:Ni,Fe-hydrogenase I large subunit
MNTLQQDLRTLVANYGIEKVHTSLHTMMRQDYEFLAHFFKEQTLVAAPAVHEQQTLESVLTPTKVKNVKIVVKKSEVEPIPEIIADAPAPTENTMEQENKFRPPAEMKEFQRLAVEKKRVELQAQGVDPKTLLTKENLKKWVEDEGNTYAWVAREKVGVPESEVSSLAKSWGISSKISKKRGMLIAKLRSS